MCVTGEGTRPAAEPLLLTEAGRAPSLPALPLPRAGPSLGLTVPSLSPVGSLLSGRGVGQQRQKQACGIGASSPLRAKTRRPWWRAGCGLTAKARCPAVVRRGPRAGVPGWPAGQRAPAGAPLRGRRGWGGGGVVQVCSWSDLPRAPQRRDPDCRPPSQAALPGRPLLRSAMAAEQVRPGLPRRPAPAAGAPGAPLSSGARGRGPCVC